MKHISHRTTVPIAIPPQEVCKTFRGCRRTLAHGTSMPLPKSIYTLWFLMMWVVIRLDLSRHEHWCRTTRHIWRYSLLVRPKRPLEATLTVDITSEECTKVYTEHVDQSDLDQLDGTQPSESCSAVASQQNPNCCIPVRFERPAPASAVYWPSKLWCRCTTWEDIPTFLVSLHLL